MPSPDREPHRVDLRVGTFEDWYRREHPRLLASITLVARDPEVAREATDEAFTRALERWDRVSRMASPEGWTFRVAANVVRRRHRRAALEQKLLLRDRPARAAPPALDPTVWAAVAALPDRQREAVALRYLLGLTQAEVAAAMGVAPGTASATLAAARRALVPLLGPDVADDVPTYVENPR
jgi:RNA polymerase sigma-70 factor (ECF subfamily)